MAYAVVTETVQPCKLKDWSKELFPKFFLIYLAVASSKSRSGLSSSAARQLQSDKATNEQIEQFLN